MVLGRHGESGVSVSVITEQEIVSCQQIEPVLVQLLPVAVTTVLVILQRRNGVITYAVSKIYNYTIANFIIT